MLGGFYALARSVGWVRGKRDERGSVVNRLYARWTHSWNATITL
jgi:hypothetical protein